MNVLCIRGVRVGEAPVNGTPAEPHEVIVEGKIYGVRETLNMYGHTVYRLRGIAKTCYTADRFIPVGGPSETDLISRRYDEEVSRLDKEFDEIMGMAKSSNR